MSRVKSTNSTPKTPKKSPVSTKNKVAKLVPKNDPAEEAEALEAADQIKTLNFIESKRYDTQLAIFCAMVSNPGRGWKPAQDVNIACEAADMFLEAAVNHM